MSGLCGSAANYLTRMEVPGEYCDHIFIQKMAEIIKRDLIIIFVQPGAGFRRLPGGPGGTEMIEKQPVFLAYYDEIRYAGGHYQALEPISEETWRSFPPNLSTVTSANFRPSATSTGSAPPEKRTMSPPFNSTVNSYGSSYIDSPVTLVNKTVTVTPPPSEMSLESLRNLVQRKGIDWPTVSNYKCLLSLLYYII